MLVNQSPDHKPHESRASIRTDARLDSATRQKMDDLAIRFHQSRAAVLCHIMQWSLSRKETPPLHQAESYGPVCHLHLYIPSELHEHVANAATAAGVKGARWLRHMVRQITITSFPASWQEERSEGRAHDSHTYETRFMLRFDHLTREKLADLSTHVNKPASEVICHLITQAKPEDFPKSWAHAGGRTPHTTGPAERHKDQSKAHIMIYVSKITLLLALALLLGAPGVITQNRTGVSLQDV